MSEQLGLALILAFALGVLVALATNELIWTMAAQRACGVFVQ